MKLKEEMERWQRRSWREVMINILCCLMWVSFISLLKQDNWSLIKFSSFNEWMWHNVIYLINTLHLLLNELSVLPDPPLFHLISLFLFHRYVCVLRRSSAARRSWPPMWHVRSSRRPTVSFVPGLMSTSYWCNCQRTVSAWTLRTFASSWRRSRVCL